MSTAARSVAWLGAMRRGFGLHLKLALAAAVTMFFCIGLLAVILLYRQSNVLNDEIQRASVQLEKGLVQRGVLLAEGMAASMETAIAGYDFAFITGTVRTMQRKNENLAYSFLTNASGITIVHTDPRAVGTRSPTPDGSASPRYVTREDGKRVVEITHPLIVGGREWGWLVLGFDLSPIEQQAQAAVARGRTVLARSTTLAMLIAMGVALLGLGVSVLMSRRLLRPIGQLASDAATIAEGNLDHEVAAVTSSDEIGVLARQFEAMRQSINSYIGELVVAKQVAESSMREEKRLRGEIEEHSRLLESKVEERTAELQAINKRLTEYDRLKSEFLSNVSHELRSPLAAISAAAKIVSRYSHGNAENNKRFGRVILDETERLTRLINDLLDLSKIEAGKTEWHFEHIDQPVALLSHVVTTFRPLYEESGIELLLESEDGLPPIRGDRDRLIQVLTNLCSNARKFTPSGGRVVVAARAAEDEGRTALRISVTDTGPGIPVEEREEVFERFHQVVGANKPKGTGLGLSICRQVVTYHGGTIWVEAPDEGGTCMVVLLPAADAFATDHSAAAAEA